MYDYNLTNAWAQALTGSPETAVFNWRFINDRDKATPAIKRRGSIAAIWNEAVSWNSSGYGIFACINEMDGTGYYPDGQPIQGESGDKLENVAAIRAHVVDLDNLSAMENLTRADYHNPRPWFAVATSPGKAHVYWPLHGSQRYNDNETYRTIQRKLRQFYDGDKAVIDATRVLRVPGFYHCKGEPHLVTCFAMSGYGTPVARDMMMISLAHINAVDTGGGRHPLGDPELSAPSIDWLWYALESMPIDGMDHGEFVSFTAAYKQAGWTLADPDELKQRWLAWCERFGTESKGLAYNLKHWDSITDTEVGWKSLLRRNPALNAQMMFRGVDFDASALQSAVPRPALLPQPQQVNTAPTQAEEFGPLLLGEDCQQYFRDCTFVTKFGTILDPLGNMLGPGQFNGKYGGPRFVISAQGAPTDEPWKAATRSIFWRIPVVDYLRFLPHETPGLIVSDELGRTGVNTYRPAIIRRIQGDPGPFLRHLSLIFPEPNDQKIILDYFAHNAQYPGHKIPWAPLFQSTEGVGKKAFKELFQYIVGSAYFHPVKARQITESGAKFNGWMRAKLFLYIDEVKTDERRELMEVLKEWLTEHEIEVEAKGHDQVKEDNYANWAMASNWKDALPINQNSRRIAPFFSPIQSKEDKRDRQMGKAYFDGFFHWFNADGKAILAHWLTHEYEIERGSLDGDAPVTSSLYEAIRQGRSPAERAILDAVDAGLPGFRSGWIGTTKAMEHLQHSGVRINTQGAVERVLEGLGYHMIGRSARTFMNEGNAMGVPPVLFNLNRSANANDYSNAQGYGNI